MKDGEDDNHPDRGESRPTGETSLDAADAWFMHGSRARVIAALMVGFEEVSNRQGFNLFLGGEPIFPAKN